jgi:hypothetical protein
VSARIAVAMVALVCGQLCARAVQAGDHPRGLRELGSALKRGWDRTGVVVHGGVDIGVPGFGGIHLGAGYKHAAVGDRAGGGAFAIGNAGAFVLGRGHVLSFNPKLRGGYTNLAGYEARNPIYGDRICTSLVPGFASVGASRTGGLGLKIAPPQWVAAACLVRPNLDIYIKHPRLAPVSNKILDGVDRVKARAKRCVAPLKRRVKARIARVRKARACRRGR